ncbi:MAG: YeeE/YedE family protein [Gammaproteobacteria bacterium]
MELQAYTWVLVYGFLTAFVLGAVAHKTNFCTMGAVSDWINMGNKGRLWAWFTAIAVAILGALAVQAFAGVNLDATLPPYRSSGFAGLRYLLGGVLFGVGMTLAGGCGSKTLINIGGGSLKSVLVLVIAGTFAYLMTKTAFYASLFHPWVSATTVDLAAYGARSQALPDLLGAALGIDSGLSLHASIGGALALLILVCAFRDPGFRKNRNNLIGGVGVGLAVVAGWYITGGQLGREALEAVEWLDQKPLGVGVQSYTFINPMGEALYYLSAPTNTLRITFGVAGLLGVILGAMSVAVLGGKFHLVGFSSRLDLLKHAVGAALMGIGGVLAMGCTIGQGVTGVSTLALGSFLALGGILFGSVMTLKIQYYRIAYEGEATFTGALLSTLADLHLLPAALRRLDPP